MTAFVAVGCSLGGFRAVGTVLAGLPRGFSAPIAVVQHRSSHGTEDYAAAIRRGSPLAVREAEDKEVPQPGVVYLAPAGYHLLLDAGAFALSVDEPVNFARPSIDVMFESLAAEMGPAAIAVVLSGASRDGCEGAVRVREAGGRVVVQEPAEAESSVLPRATLAAVSAIATDVVVLPLADMAPWLVTAVGPSVASSIA
jgi:two-component system chemotaxis response regulator CheB